MNYPVASEGSVKVGDNWGRVMKAQRAATCVPKGQSWGGLLEEGERAPFPPVRGSGERCKLPSGVRGNGFPIF